MNTKHRILLVTGSVALFSALNLDAQTTPGPQPGICNRPCWAARAPNCGLSTMTALTRAIVHHTAAPSDWNTTSIDTSKPKVRAVQNYHMDAQGWCDIGYHFVFDKLGNIFEGRDNSMFGLRRGIHDACNGNSFGFTMLGYFHPPYNHSPTPEMLNSFYNTIAWRMPAGWSPYGSGTYCSKTVGFLDGHRKVVATACPGDLVHPNLITENYFGGPMRTAVAQRRTPAANNAAVVSLSHPSSVVAGSVFSASVTMNNNGGTTWTTDGTPHRLGSQNPQDNTRWGTSRIGLSANVSPGQNHTFTANFTAPTTPGTYPFDWKMVEDGVQWFGATATGSITVTAPSTAVIVDNPAATFLGPWSVGSASTDKFGADYRFRSTAAISEPATFTGSLTAGGKNVSAWWPQGANRSTATPYIVAHAGGTTTVNKNQQVNGGSWQLLGNWSFNAGNNTVKVSCWAATGFVVMADAVKWE